MDGQQDTKRSPLSCTSENGPHPNGCAISGGQARNGHQLQQVDGLRGTAARSPEPFIMVLLAGALKPSLLRQRLDMPALCLPVAANRLLLDLWLELLDRTEGFRSLRIVVSSSDDQDAVREAYDHRAISTGAVEVEVIVDPTMWRGPAGVLRDIVHDADLQTESAVVVADAACLPPRSLDPLSRALTSSVGGVVGSSSRNEPAGLYLFRAGILSSIAAKGYHDIKEQLLPDLYTRGVAVTSVPMVDEIYPVRTLPLYLRAVEHVLLTQPAALRVSPDAIVSGSARVAETCVIHENVIVEDGAIVHRSVVLPGARIGGGAVVSNSIAGFGVSVEPRRLVRDQVITSSEAALKEHEQSSARSFGRFDLGPVRQGTMRGGL